MADNNAFNVLGEWARMVKADADGGCTIDCIECPIQRAQRDLGHTSWSCVRWIRAFPASATEIIREWSIKHPANTWQSKMLEVFPQARILEDGVLAFCPRCYVEFARAEDYCDNKNCADCRREFWLQVVDDD